MLSQEGQTAPYTVGNLNLVTLSLYLRCLHDEAYLYINQAVTQEGPSIHRLDVALMM
jgi:hypothetical protein